MDALEAGEYSLASNTIVEKYVRASILLCVEEDRDLALFAVLPGAGAIVCVHRSVLQ